MKLTREEYLLVKLAEECSEVIQRITKSQTFGLDEIQKSNPDETRTNRERINYELTDLRGTIELLADTSIAYWPNNAGVAEKKRKLEKYMQYSRDLGILENT